MSVNTKIVRKNIIVSTGGACKCNPGPGGYAAILKYGPNEKIVRGFEETTTNNRMEIMAIIEAVKALKVPCCIAIETNSQYIKNGIANAKERSENGWRTKSGAKCVNTDLWQELTELGKAGKHHFQYIDGNENSTDMARCTTIAREQISLHLEVNA